jgi:hypothetical protein
MLAKHALSQLSYGPGVRARQSGKRGLVGPVPRSVSEDGPVDKATKVHQERSDWWAEVDLNHRPHAYQACALTA